jgi:hypothetical protein
LYNLGETIKEEEQMAVELAEDKFKAVVEADVRDKVSDDEAAMLRQLENVPRWYNELNLLKRDIEAQFVQRKADLLDFQQGCLKRGRDGKQEFFDEKADHEAWKTGAVRWKQLIEAKMVEAKRLRAEFFKNNPDSPDRDNVGSRIATALERVADVLERIAEKV